MIGNRIKSPITQTTQTEDPRKRKGTGFTNVKRILEANRGSRLGQEVASGIGGVAQKARSELETKADQFRTDIGKKAEERGAQKTALETEIGRFATPSGTEGMGTTSTTEGTEQPKYSPTMQTSFGEFLKGQYKGPTEIEDKDKLRSTITQTEELGGLTRDVGGRGELLRRFVGGRDYTRGERSLDTALLGTAGQKELSQAARQARGLGQEYARTVGEAEGLAQIEKAKTKSAAEDISGQLGEAIRNIQEKEVDLLVGEAQKREDARLTAISGLENILNEQKPSTMTDENFKNKQKIAITAELQKIKDAGFIDEATYNMLTAPEMTGLKKIQGKLVPQYDYSRGFLGRAISEKGLSGAIGDIKSIIGSAEAAKNLSRTGLATPEQASRLSALQQYLGQTDEYGDIKKENLFTAGQFLPEDKLKEFQISTLDTEIKNLKPVIAEATKKVNDFKHVPVLTSFGTMSQPGPFEQLLINDKGLIPTYNKEFPQDDEGKVDINLAKKLFPKYWDKDWLDAKDYYRDHRDRKSDERKKEVKDFLKQIDKYNKAVTERNELIKKILLPRLNIKDQLEGIIPPPEQRSTTEFRDPTIPTGGPSKYPNLTNQIKK